MDPEEQGKLKFSLKIRTDRERADYLQKKVTELIANRIDKEEVKAVLSKYGYPYFLDVKPTDMTKFKKEMRFE